MIELLIKNIFDNANRIESVVKYINKIDKKYSFTFLILAINACLSVKIAKNNRERIINLENELKEMKSKGE